LTQITYFDIRRNMETNDAVAALAALAQESRLDAFRLLVQAGPEGMQAGQISAALGVPPNTLTFHFDRLRMAGLVSVRREGRAMIYTAHFTTMNALLAYLTENCCGGVPCTPAQVCKPASGKRLKSPA
jgi:ArsR family transcriptional regulator, arsenate/arsenite/antimonite-responsive transcriptional repressor